MKKLSFEILNSSLKLSEHFDINKMWDVGVCSLLKEYFNDWVLIINEDPSMDGIYHVVSYDIVDWGKGGGKNGIKITYDQNNVDKVSKDKLNNIEICNATNEYEDGGTETFNLLYSDTIYALTIINNDEIGVGKVRWFKKGKLMKFEQFEIK